MAPLNPKAAEFYPKSLTQEPSPEPKSPSCSCAKPGKLIHPHRFPCYHLKCLPPRLLNQKVLVHKSQNFSPRKPLPPPRLLKQKVWVHKNQNFSPRKSLPPPKEAEPKSLFGDKTAVMIRNIPNIFGRKDLLRILDNHCRRENKVQHQTKSSYDFLYLPMDFVKHANLGYAFVNFTSSVAAERFRREYHNFSWVHSGYNKICEISVAKFQGKEEYAQHFMDSKFPCHTDDYLPVILSPPSDGFTRYRLTTLGYRVRTRGGGPRRGIQVV